MRIFDNKFSDSCRNSDPDICDPFCQNEFLLCTRSKFSFWYIIAVYILPFTMVVKFLKSDNPKRSYAHLTFGV